ncbi:MAG: endonuclease/exonuclease/phosphatase family protein [Candidatus Hydrogenedentes bacterium]|nr:endonuclease/exonuclease/phosphatase family protein [Candidatus Hydrogenedentota bacterium]
MRNVSRLLGIAAAVMTVLGTLAGCKTTAEDGPVKDGTVRVMSFNIWVGGEGGKFALEHTAAVIRAAGADIVGIQEADGREKNGVKPDRGREVAALLGWNYAAQGGGKAILSRHEIVRLTPNKQGAELRLPSGDAFYLFNVHLFHAPYQPYQLLDIPYEDAPFLHTKKELIDAAEVARGAELREALEEMKPLVDAGARVALTGDFNEPSHLDWTAKAQDAGVVPLAVAYPASRAVVELGLIDVFRALHPDEAAQPGRTWTPTTREDDPADRHDRIDFVYASPGVEIVQCEIVGESRERADVVVTPYPSDHRAVVATLRVPPNQD